MSLAQRFVGRLLPGRADESDGNAPARPTLDELDAFDALDVDALVECVGNERRRTAISILSGIGPEGVTQRYLADEIARMETDADTIDDVGQRARQAVYVSLHQHHLEKLEAHGLIEWEPGRGVWPTERCRHVAVVVHELEALAGPDGGEERGE